VKTVRFAKVVAESGKPEPYTLWSAPEADLAFQSALKAHRVMTLHQDNLGNKKDFGEVGYTEGEKGSLLVFPKSLKSFEGLRVIGIDYELMAEPPTPKPAPPPRPAKSKPKAKPPEPKLTPTLPRAAAAKPSPPVSQPPKPEPPAPVVAPPPVPIPKPKIEPLRIFRPEDEKPPRVGAAPKHEPERPKAPETDAQPDLKQLKQEIAKAMKKLEQGNQVAAYQILEKAIKS
jgi:hypothetical protein